MKSVTLPLPPTLNGDYEAFLEKSIRAWSLERGFTVAKGVYKGRRGLSIQGVKGWAWVYTENSAVTLVGADGIVEELRSHLKERLLSLYYYEGKGHIYLVYAGRESVTPSLREPFLKVLLRRLFAENMVYAFILAALVSILFYEALGPLAAPLAIGFVSLFAVTASPRLVPKIVAHWSIEEGEPVTIVDIEISGREYRRKYRYLVDRRILLRLKREVWPLLSSGSISGEHVVDILSRLMNGEPILRDAVKVRVKRYELSRAVEALAKRLGGVKPGSLYLYNVLYRNAMSVGVGRHSAVILTSGLLIDMDEGEVEAVIGHELSHLYRGDIILFTLAAVAEYAARMYYFFVYNPVLLTYPALVVGYLLAAMTGLFMYAKLLEIRADMDVISKGYGRQLASALVKIGYPLLLEEKSVLLRVLEWLSWRPHPPLRYRILLAKKYAEGGPRSVWLSSLAALVHGFLSAA